MKNPMDIIERRLELNRKVLENSHDLKSYSKCIGLEAVIAELEYLWGKFLREGYQPTKRDE